MLYTTNIRMLQKHSKVATFEGSFEFNTFVYALDYILIPVEIITQQNDWTKATYKSLIVILFDQTSYTSDCHNL